MIDILREPMLRAAALVLFGVLAVTGARGQTPGYGRTEDKWAPYESGEYVTRLSEIAASYRIPKGVTDYLIYEGIPDVIGSVYLFRFSVDRDCRDNKCLFVLFASDLKSAPIVTHCQFKQAGLAHLFNPDGSNFFGFEFVCKDSLLWVQVSKAQFRITSAVKR